MQMKNGYVFWYAVNIYVRWNQSRPEQLNLKEQNFLRAHADAVRVRFLYQHALFLSLILITPHTLLRIFFLNLPNFVNNASFRLAFSQSISFVLLFYFIVPNKIFPLSDSDAPDRTNQCCTSSKSALIRKNVVVRKI